MVIKSGINLDDVFYSVVQQCLLHFGQTLRSCM